MDYLVRDHPRRTHPRDIMPEARSILVVAASYYSGGHSGNSCGVATAPGGKIARYAWGEDYHHVLKSKLNSLAEWIAAEARSSGLAENLLWRAATDSAPLDERALAARAGLGFIGKNTLLLNPRAGSWFLLAELLISIELPPDDPLPAAPERSCGSCRRCIEVCPTHALADAYDLDPRACISYLTIEDPAPIPDQHAARLEGWAFGCDLCQEVCPFNAAPAMRIIPEFASDRGAGPLMRESDLDATPSNKQFEKKWAHSPLSRAGRKGMLKNFAALKNWMTERANYRANQNP